MDEEGPEAACGQEHTRHQERTGRVGNADTLESADMGHAGDKHGLASSLPVANTQQVADMHEAAGSLLAVDMRGDAHYQGRRLSPGQYLVSQHWHRGAGLEMEVALLDELQECSWL